MRGAVAAQGLRAAVPRPTQTWVADTQCDGFAEECRRQTRLAAAADLADTDLAAFLGAAFDDIEQLRT